MTEEQYNQLMQYASDLRSALYVYEEKYGIINLEADPVPEIVTVGAKLMHLVESIEPIHSCKHGDPF